MKKISILLLLVLLFATGCETRTNNPDSQPSSSISEEGITEESASSQASEISVPSENSDNEIIINDKEQIDQATAIIKDLFLRAELCDKLYRGDLKHDENMPPLNIEGIDYLLVSNFEFQSMEDIQTYWSGTFVTDTSSTKHYEEIKERNIYMPSNGQLWVQSEALEAPFTLGEWNLKTLELIEFEENTIVLSMETTLLGNDNERQKLTLEKAGDAWLLSENYFLD